MGLFGLQSRKERRASHEREMDLQGRFDTLKNTHEQTVIRCNQLAGENTRLKQRVADLERVCRMERPADILLRSYVEAMQEVADFVGVPVTKNVGQMSADICAEVAEVMSRYDHHAAEHNETLDRLQQRVDRATKLLADIAAHAEGWRLPAFEQLMHDVLDVLGGKPRADKQAFVNLVTMSMAALDERDRRKVVKACGM